MEERKYTASEGDGHGTTPAPLEPQTASPEPDRLDEINAKLDLLLAASGIDTEGLNG